MMHSIVYLQPGETAGCAGCHERNAASVAGRFPCFRRGPAATALRDHAWSGWIQAAQLPAAGPAGARQALRELPQFERSRRRKAAASFLAGRRARAPFSQSYDVLAPCVPYSAWGHRPTARTYPDQFGARASKLMKQLLAGHHEVRLSQGRSRSPHYLDGCQRAVLRHFQPQGSTAATQGHRIGP